jgi:diacylglycerol kinase family enzyme
MRILVVVNSFASSVTARNKVLVEEVLLDHGHDVTLKETNRRGHATRFAQDGASRGFDVVLAFGGDGTVNEVANGLVGSTAVFGVIPGGSTNVFARILGLTNDPVAATQQLIDGLDAATVQPIGLGNVNGRYFCFHTGIGFDAAVVARVEKRASLKRWLGHPLFMWAGLTTFFRSYDRKHAHFHVQDATKETPSAFTIVLNANPYTYLGNRAFNLAPDCTLSNALTTVSFPTMPTANFVRALLGTLTRSGAHGNAVVHDNIAEFTVSASKPFPYQLDGDYLGETCELVFRWEPNALNLIFPVRSKKSYKKNDATP